MRGENRISAELLKLALTHLAEVWRLAARTLCGAIQIGSSLLVSSQDAAFGSAVCEEVLPRLLPATVFVARDPCAQT